MWPGLIVFPHDFRSTRRHQFYVFAHDGHGSLTWVFRGHNSRRPRLTCWHADHEPECAPYRGFESLPVSEGAYSWILQAPDYIPYEPDAGT